MNEPERAPIEITIRLDPSRLRPDLSWLAAVRAWLGRHRRGLTAIALVGSGTIVVFLWKGIVSGRTETAVAAAGVFLVLNVVVLALVSMKNRFSPLVSVSEKPKATLPQLKMQFDNEDHRWG